MKPEPVDDSQNVEAESIVDPLEMDSDSLDQHLSNIDYIETASGENLPELLSFTPDVFDSLENDDDVDKPVDHAVSTLTDVEAMTASKTLSEICIVDLRTIDAENSKSTISVPLSSPPSENTTTETDAMKSLSDVSMQIYKTITPSPSYNAQFATPGTPSLGTSAIHEQTGTVATSLSSCVGHSDTLSTVMPASGEIGASTLTRAKTEVDETSMLNYPSSSNSKRQGNPRQKVPRRYRGLSEEEAEAVRKRTNQMEKERIQRQTDALKMLESALPECLRQQDTQMTQFNVLKTTSAYTFLLSVCKIFNASMDGQAFKFGLRMIQDCQKARWEVHLINMSVYDHLFENEKGCLFRTLKQGIFYDTCSLMVESGVKHASPLLSALQTEAATSRPVNDYRCVSKYPHQGIPKPSTTYSQQCMMGPPVSAFLPQTSVSAFLRPQTIRHTIPPWLQSTQMGFQFAQSTMPLGNTTVNLYAQMQPANRFVPLLQRGTPVGAGQLSFSYFPQNNGMMGPSNLTHNGNSLSFPVGNLQSPSGLTNGHGIKGQAHVLPSIAPDEVNQQNTSACLSIAPGMSPFNVGSIRNPALAKPSTASGSGNNLQNGSGLGCDFDNPNVFPADPRYR